MMIVCDIQISKKEGNRKIGIKNNVNFLWFYRLTKIFLWFYVNYCKMKYVEKVVVLKAPTTEDKPEKNQSHKVIQSVYTY